MTSDDPKRTIVTPTQPDWNAIREGMRKQGKDLKPLNAEAAAAMGECFWRQLTGRLAWCEVHGCLREGSYAGEDYRDPDTGNPIRLTSTGYYRPGLGGGEVWEDGPPPSKYLVTLYGEPYKVERPLGIAPEPEGLAPETEAGVAREEQRQADSEPQE